VVLVETGGGVVDGIDHGELSAGGAGGGQHGLQRSHEQEVRLEAIGQPSDPTCMLWPLSPSSARSSRGLGHHPLKVETRVRIPYGLRGEMQVGGPFRRASLHVRTRNGHRWSRLYRHHRYRYHRSVQGSIERRGKSWRIRIDVGRDPVTGRRRQLTRTIGGTKRDAQEVMARLLLEGETPGRRPQGSPATVARQRAIQGPVEAGDPA
jgi:Arm domain-containing DNA-binding protein